MFGYVISREVICIANNKKKTQMSLDEFLADFSAESSGSGLRPKWTPERDEVHTCTVTSQATVTNDFGESTMLTVQRESSDEEEVWFLAGFENRDWDRLEVASFPVSIRFARVQETSGKTGNPVNRLRVIIL